jgi:NADH pyrophosphatase NudC (nudix superfamily)
MDPAKFCARCGTTLEERTIDGRARLACSSESCDFVHWNSPVPVVAAIVQLEDQIVLVRNHGWPDKMFGLVTGFLEKGEAPDRGVLREVDEELGLSGEVAGLVGVYAFEAKNELIVAYHVIATGEVRLGDELAAHKCVPVDRLKPWPFGTGHAVRDWLERGTLQAGSAPGV